MGRVPDEDEARVLLTWLDRQRTRFAGEPAAALALATGELPVAAAPTAGTPPAGDTPATEATAGGTPAAPTDAAAAGSGAAPAANVDAGAGPSPAELAAWTATARVLLNLDETITRQ